jgi:hypothetical protein
MSGGKVDGDARIGICGNVDVINQSRLRRDNRRSLKKGNVGSAFIFVYSM